MLTVSNAWSTIEINQKKDLTKRRHELDKLAESHKRGEIRYHEYEQSARQVTRDIQKQAWQTSFTHVKSIPVSVTGNGEEMIREFCLFINEFCIVASSTPGKWSLFAFKVDFR